MVDQIINGIHRVWLQHLDVQSNRQFLFLEFHCYSITTQHVNYLIYCATTTSYNSEFYRPFRFRRFIRIYLWILLLLRSSVVALKFWDFFMVCCFCSRSFLQFCFSLNAVHFFNWYILLNVRRYRRTLLLCSDSCTRQIRCLLVVVLRDFKTYN